MFKIFARIISRKNSFKFFVFFLKKPLTNIILLIIIIVIITDNAYQGGSAVRYSRQRELITEIIKGRCDHPTADMIYNSAREVEPNISLGTVYRNLKLLADEKVIITLETEDKRLHYDGDLSRHSHFICSNCGKIVDLFRPAKTPSELAEMGLTVTGEKCVYYGLCNECIDQNEQTV